MKPMEMALMRWHNSDNVRRTYKNIHEFANVCFAFDFRVIVCERHLNPIAAGIIMRFYDVCAHRWRFCDVSHGCFHSTFCPVSARCFYTITNDGRHRQKKLLFSNRMHRHHRVYACHFIHSHFNLFLHFIFFSLTHSVGRSVRNVIVCESKNTEFLLRNGIVWVSFHRWALVWVCVVLCWQPSQTDKCRSFCAHEAVS